MISAAELEEDQVDMAVIGLGYVGLPLVTAAVDAGLTVFGLDVDEAVVAGLQAGASHIEDISNADVIRALSQGFLCSTDPAGLRGSDAIVVTVPTPLIGNEPDLSAVIAASEAIGRHLRSGHLVVLESTSYPGTTEEVMLPILEEHSGLLAGRDFYLAFSPERIDPRNEVYRLHNTPKVVGGVDSASTKAAIDLYSRFCDVVVPVSGTREAEMSKLLENTYRHINIALVNEMAMFCHDLGIDLWESIRAAATKPFGFQAFFPGPGVGGHCIPIDPNYLSSRVRELGYSFQFVDLAQEINSRMPGYIVQRVERLLERSGRTIEGAQVVLLGVAYKPDMSDTRNTPATDVARHLMDRGASVSYCDPLVDSFAVDGVDLKRLHNAGDAAAMADLSVLLVNHSEFELGAIVDQSRLVFDTRGVVNGPNVERL